MKWTNLLGKWARLSVAGLALAAGGAGCLTRPVSKQAPTTKDSFNSQISQAQVDKVDLLFMIDNSSSMGDKQAILADAVPLLVTGLLQPKCVDANGNPTSGVADPVKGTKDNHYGCASGDPEFTPVSDMHIGIVSSSLGTFGGDVCPDSGSGGRYNDHGHLLNLVKGGGNNPDAQPSNFLAWYPNSADNMDKTRHPPPATPVGDLAKLNTDFQGLVTGVDQTGCGLEAQLESWFHFLIAPDPWVKITLDANQKAVYNDVDIDLLRQRSDFLRTDSLVAIISLSDETDSSPDPLSVGGQGWAFDAYNFPGSNTYRSSDKNAGSTAPLPTSACATNPGSPDCTSCGFAATCNGSDPACQKIKNDPNCQKNGGYYGPTEDELNARWQGANMKRNYGIDPQYPISRYVNALTQKRVPDRASEHVDVMQGGGRSIGPYVGTAKCTNPLFARGFAKPDGTVVTHLPRDPGDELCALLPSTRGAELVFFAHIGGVPNQLLYKKKDGSMADDNTPLDQLDPVNGRISPPNWRAIIGADPLNFNLDGIDPHMIESKQPRPGLPAPTASDTTDIINGREWDTGLGDLQYACTFPLPMAAQRDCTTTMGSCDCGTKMTGGKPPLCMGTTQVRAKAYPTTREFYVVKGLGENGIIASLCPIQLNPADKTAPDYGYNPAVAAIIDRLKNALTKQCLPQTLCCPKPAPDPDNPGGFICPDIPGLQVCPQNPDGTLDIPCLILAQLSDGSQTCGQFGLQQPPPDVLAKFKEAQKQESGNTAVDGGVDLSNLPVCVVPSVTSVDNNGVFKDCSADTNIDWCYLTGKAAGKCPQAVVFSKGSAALGGARFSLQCIRQFSEGQAAGDQPTAGK